MIEMARRLAEIEELSATLLIALDRGDHRTARWLTRRIKALSS